MTKSTSPESSAAVRVPLALIGCQMTSVTLPFSGETLFHQFGFSTSNVFTSGWRDLTMNGPVPLVLRDATVSSLSL